MKIHADSIENRHVQPGQLVFYANTGFPNGGVFALIISNEDCAKKNRRRICMHLLGDVQKIVRWPFVSDRKDLFVINDIIK